MAYTTDFRFLEILYHIVIRRGIELHFSWRYNFTYFFYLQLKLFEHVIPKHYALMQVIEYIKFLQEKEQKHELYSGWNQENAKLVPWVI